MSTTPIWDATLADAPSNIWQASSVFPQPWSLPDGRFDFVTSEFVPNIITDRALCDTEPRVTYVWPLQPAFTDWRAIAGKKSDWTLKA